MARFWKQRFFGTGVGQGSASATTPTLSIADNGNGTATATIASSTTGSDNIVYTQSVGGGGNWGTGSFTNSGNRTGNGTVGLTLSAGYYWAFVQSSISGTSAVSAQVYFQVTNGSTAIHYQCLTAIQARIRLLTLTGLDDANVVIYKLPSSRHHGTGQEFALPGITVSSLGSETIKQVFNIRDDVTYPCVIAIMAADNQRLQENHNQYLLWRQRIADAFRNQHLSGITVPTRCELTYATIADPSLFWNANFYHSSMIINCIARQPRGAV